MATSVDQLSVFSRVLTTLRSRNKRPEAMVEWKWACEQCRDSELYTESSRLLLTRTLGSALVQHPLLEARQEALIAVTNDAVGLLDMEVIFLPVFAILPEIAAYFRQVLRSESMHKEVREHSLLSCLFAFKAMRDEADLVLLEVGSTLVRTIRVAQDRNWKDILGYTLVTVDDLFNGLRHIAKGPPYSVLLVKTCKQFEAVLRRVDLCPDHVRDAKDLLRSVQKISAS